MSAPSGRLPLGNMQYLLRAGLAVGDVGNICKSSQTYICTPNSRPSTLASECFVTLTAGATGGGPPPPPPPLRGPTIFSAVYPLSLHTWSTCIQVSCSQAP